MDVHQCLHRLGGLGAIFMSALDLINAYWQLTLHESSQAYTTFTVPGRGKFDWTVTPMGLKTTTPLKPRLVHGAVEVSAQHQEQQELQPEDVIDRRRHRINTEEDPRGIPSKTYSPLHSSNSRSKEEQI